ncbi:MAG: transporter related [Candidatus Taylorbacteria bacterium]|nr:transporter related [Candidatus Taylorbacteria bacterium]
MKKIISLDKVYKIYKEEGRREFTALRDISFSVHEKEFLILLGPSGSGKSTILRILSELDTPSSGKVIQDEIIDKKDMQFVFQQSAVLPWLTVSKNVELGLIGRNIDATKRNKMVLDELTEFGLHNFAHSQPRELSGGMKQRAGLARAFVTEPKLIFLDEPFSELDFFTAADLQQELLRLWKEHEATVVMVSHNIDEAIELADRIIIMSANPGEIKEIVTNEIPRPRNGRTPEFFAMQDKLRDLLTPKIIK